MQNTIIRKFMKMDMNERNNITFYVYISALIMFSVLCLMVGINLVSSEGFPNENLFLIYTFLIDSYGLLFSSLFLFLQKSWSFYLYKCFALLLSVLFTSLFTIGGYKVISLMVYVVFLILSVFILNRTEIRNRFRKS